MGKLLDGLAPQREIGPGEMRRGMDRLVQEPVYSSATTAMTSGVILTAFALHLGASNLVVGLLASAPFLGQLLQGPAILLVEKLRQRKLISVVSSLVGRSMLLLMAAAVLLPPGFGLAVLVLAQCVLCSVNAFGACSWNAWLRDLVPDRQLGDIVARRTVYATMVSLIAGLLAAFTLDRPGGTPEQRDYVFLALYAVGFVGGMVSAWLVGRIPEPQMSPREDRIRLIPLLRQPLGDENFRRLLVFLVSWQFAANLATPFFAVYFLRQLGLEMTLVMMLSVVTQLANLLAVRNWGYLSDRFANKSVLAVAAPTYILCIAAMVGASQFHNRELLVAYLIGLHLLMGFAVAGVTLATANITLRLSPKGSATSYVATGALASSLAAGLAPLLGGAFADFFARRRFEILTRWTSPEETVTLQPLELSGWDFYFLIAAVFGVYAIHRLALVREEGEIAPRHMLQEVLDQTRRSVRNISTVAGFRTATELPGNLLREARVRARLQRRRARRAAVAKVRKDSAVTSAPARKR